jgi:hypothetical protein
MKVLNGGYNRYKYEVYENNKTENLVNLTLIIRSECTLDNDELEIFLTKIKNRILEHYNKKIRYTEIETVELSIAKYQGIARYNILIKR